jgi:hypothetical protein
VIEHGNPELLLLRGSKRFPLERSSLTLEQWRDRTIHYSEFDLQLGDRIVCFSDGITQSGLGRRGMPLGWGADQVSDFVSELVGDHAEISSQELARRVVAEAIAHDGAVARDDITCGVVYFRRPRRLLVVTGPPYAKERDMELAETLRQFEGRTAICGGTTANIVSRLLGRPVKVLLGRLDPEIPPAAEMPGVDLVTEGTMTLARVAEMLEQGPRDQWPDNPARDLMNLMLQSDIVQFLVGTRINEAHQDPNVPVELDLRRNIVRKIAGLLEAKYLKECSVQFI